MIMKILSIGAEATIYADGKNILKKRQPKMYRVKELDDRLRMHRMRREAKVIETLGKLGVPTPKLIATDETTATITMQLVEGKKARDTINGTNYPAMAAEIGKNIGIMHKNNIVHGDLTTSNMISRSGKVYFVDFGLSLFSRKDEDKAVDLHLFRQALNSSHHEIAQECFEAAMAAYRGANSGWRKVMERLEKVEGRGRNKGKKQAENI